MKVKVVFDLNQEARLAVSHRVGNKKPASRADIKSWIESCVESTLDDLRAEMLAAKGDAT